MYTRVLASCLCVLLLLAAASRAAPANRLLDGLRHKRSADLLTADVDDSASSSRVAAPQEQTARRSVRRRRSPAAAMITHMIRMCMQGRNEKCAFTVTNEGRSIQVVITEE